MGGKPEKAGRYLSLLDEARCKGNWDEVPELARKVEKHAPSRKCLAYTARAETQIAKEPTRRPPTGTRPSTSATVPSSLSHLVTELESAIAIEKTCPEDAYQAQTTLSWLYWNSGAYALAKASVPHEFSNVGDARSGTDSKLMEWTCVCMVKAAFIRGSSEEALGKRDSIHMVYEACLQSLESLPSLFAGSPEYNFWWERFFSRCCGSFYGFFREDVKAKKRTPDPHLCLAAFRSWAKHWGSPQSASMDTTSRSAVSKQTQRRLVWKSYYNLLSEIVQLDLPYYPVSQAQNVSEKPSFANHRSLQYLELKKVEAVYEGILLKEVSFPEANKINTEVDEWVDTVMSNWSILCGSNWEDDDLGAAGKGTVGRSALEILYRAATRTFHSTSVLRNLFTVHAYLAEFGLAEKALDSYVEIVMKGKSRIEKSGNAEPDLDSDEVMLETIASGIEMLCESGKRKQTQKSTIFAKQLEDWVAKHTKSARSAIETKNQLQPTESASTISPRVLTSVYKAIATSKASWARLTYESSSRSQLQSAAIESYQQALHCDHGAEKDPSILYALALVLAETRDIESAVAAIKQALASESRTFTEPVDRPSSIQDLKSRVTRTAPLAECWHLMALLLSSRQEFETAEVACQTALDQTEQLEEADHRSSDPLRKMSFFDKQHFVETKMTQVALIEINDGPETAVNMGSELLGLYNRAFGNPTSKPPLTAKSKQPPLTSVGTVKSFRTSLFGRHKENKLNNRQSTASLSVRSRRVSAGTSEAPTFSVNEEGSLRPTTNATHQLSRKSSSKLHKRTSRRSFKRSRGGSPARPQTQQTVDEKQTPSQDLLTQEKVENNTQKKSMPVIETPEKEGIAVDGSATEPQGRSTATPSTNLMTNGEQPNGIQNHRRPDTATSHDPSEVGIAVSHDLRASMSAQFDSLTPVAPDLPLNVTPEPRREPLPEHDFLLRTSACRKTPFLVPAPLFSDSTLHCFSLSLIQRIWIFIASLYRRANMLEDARGAIDEAFKQAKLLEAAVAAQSLAASVKGFEEPGWGGVRSVEETWADVYAEMGNLRVSEGDPYAAMTQFEGALSHCVDHPAASVGLANILLDTYSKKIPLQPPQPSLASDTQPAAPKNETTVPIFPKFPPTAQPDAVPNGGSTVVNGELQEHGGRKTTSKSDSLGEDPEALDLLAARDRAYGLLSALTKLGTGWDDSEAWYALARAHEESGEIEKAQESLWWVVELEEKKPVRHWRCLGEGYKLRH